MTRQRAINDQRQRLLHGLGAAQASRRSALAGSADAALAGLVYSGDITQLNFVEDNKWEFILPERGGLLWSDNFMVPMGATHKTNAAKLMDFYYQPEVAAEVAAYVNYLCPVSGAQAEMEKIDPELVEDPLIFPTNEFPKQATTERELSVEEETGFQNQFQEVIGV